MNSSQLVLPPLFFLFFFLSFFLSRKKKSFFYCADTGMEDQLPEDVLTDILRRLAPRGLAISRCVCKAWHTTIDAHRLLRVDLLPHSVGWHIHQLP